MNRAENDTETEIEAKIPAFLFSSLISSYPGPTFLERTASLIRAPGVEEFLCDRVGASWQAFKDELLRLESDPERVGELQSDYIDLFDRGSGENSVYETEYGRDRVINKGAQLVDIAGFYRAFGFEFRNDGELSEMLDHVSVELEFYTLLLMKHLVLEEKKEAEGVAIVLDARRKFLKEHLGRFLRALCERPGVRSNGFYARAFSLCRDLVSSECSELGIAPELAEWAHSRSDGEEISCGAGSGGKCGQTGSVEAG